MKTLLFMLLTSVAAFAGLTVTLNPNAQPAATGGEALFSGTLTNTSATERLFLNDIAASFTADPQSDTALASNAFFANVPGILNPGEVYAGPLFRISLSAVSPAANYTGTITLRGGADIVADGNLASASITVLATPVDQWRHQTFGDAAASPAAADAADADGDGTENLLEYALALDVLTPDVALLPAPFVLNDHLALSYVPYAPDVTYSVESSLNLLHWGTVDVEPVTVPNPQPPNRVTFRFKDAISVSEKAFLRLKVTR
ncbi:MAG: hypothetical protein JNG86_05890 [Verrucomicrobiaceae bacterium]|nr:hypothetical protein [Verrucomicrobiaceae bacterium]